MARKKQVNEDQGQLFDPNTVTSQEFAPSPSVVAGARAYTREQTGRTWTMPNTQMHSDPQRQYATYLAYRDAMKSGKESPTIRASYGALREHIGRQFDVLTQPKEQGGMGVNVDFTDDDPYESPAAMAEDVNRGNIRVFKTESTGGHNFFTNEENDKFRAVHDVMGHVATGRGFSRHGEEGAFQGHLQMFPKEAHEALTSELRGQNAALIWGGDFPDQSPGTPLVGMPDWATKTGPMPKPKKQKAKSQGDQLQLDL